MKDKMEDPDLHRLLKRQLKKAFSGMEPCLDNMGDFLALVDSSYKNFDQERKLNQRAEMISNRELKEINKTLQEKNMFLDSFNHGLAHDAKNHTANLKGLLRMFSKYQKKDDYEKMSLISKKLELSVNQMTALLDGFLYLSSADGFVESTSFEIDREQLQDSICLEIEYLIDKENHCLEFDIEVDGLFYSQSILKIILVNLISNSLKFSRSENKTLINVSVKHNTNNIIIIVKDNGMGMDLNDESSTMFKLFDRRSNTKHIKGYGIGLYMIKNILDRNNGEINIKSRLREGTEIKISIPKANKNEF